MIIGFDTEWDSRTKELLAISFAALVHGRVRSRVYDPPGDRLTPESLASLVARFVVDVGLDLPKRKRARGGQARVYLVAHFAQAEVGMFEDPLRDLKLRAMNKALHAAMPDWRDDEDRRWEFRLVDLFAFYPMGLAKIGDAIGLSKIDLPNGAIERMAEFKREQPAMFQTYAARDAEIAVAAFERFRDEMLSSFGVDPLIHKTLAGIGGAIFRYCFLKGAVVPTKKKVWRDKRRRKHVGRVIDPALTRISKDVFFNREIVRQVSLQSYWGGRVESYVRGLFVGHVIELDVVSLYPSAALLQPLPNAQTKWRHVTTIDQIMRMEGFGGVRFEFPTSCKYPCLPVADECNGHLVFPRSGSSLCTFAEIRAALALGAKIVVGQGCYGFEPTDPERNHDVGRFMRHFIKRKSESKKGTLEYVTNKLILNSLVGKFAEKLEPDRVLDLERHARQSGIAGLGEIVFRTPELRDALRGKMQLGTCWSPEWACLILGKSRALMASIIDAADPMFVSTDAVLARSDQRAKIEASSGAEELRSVDSGLTPEAEGDGVVVVRSRVYAVLQRADAVRENARVFARDEKWAVVKIARHGIPGKDEGEAASDFLACLQARSGKVAPPRDRKRLIRAPEAARTGRGVNDEVVEERRYIFGWDYKRSLDNRDANEFSGFSRTTPYTTLSRALTAVELGDIELRAKRRPRRRYVAKAKLGAIIGMHAAGESIRAIAKVTGVKKSTVHDIVKRAKKLSPDSPLVQIHAEPFNAAAE